MSDQRIDILMITHNRADYARMALSRLLDTCDENMRVWVWHNGPDMRTQEVIRSFAGHNHLHRIHISPTNEKLVKPTNWIFAEGDSPYVAKVDDDCLVVEGWASVLRETLNGHERMGVAACWHFNLDDYDESIVAPKIKTLENGRRFIQNRWVQGSGIMIKRACIEEQGLLAPDSQGITPYLHLLCKNKWMLGWPLPLVPIDHMDDPRSPNSRFKTEEDFRKHPPLSAEFAHVQSLAEWKERIKWNARQVQKAPLEEGRWASTRNLLARLWQRIRRIVGIEPEWRRAARRNS